MSVDLPASSSTCSKCDRPALASGLCMRHYQRRRRTGALADAAVPCRTRGWQPRWPSGEVDHVTSSGVAVDVLEHGDVLVSTGDRGMVALTNTQWRELAAYALAWVSCDEGDDGP